MKANRLFAAMAAIFVACGAWAQNGTMTPYSKYGYGMLRDHATSTQIAMGGVGYAMNSGRQVNVMNPASYAAIDSLTFLFDMGLNLNMLWANENGASEDNMSGGLDYITMSFPITKWMGASVGLLPYSSVGYTFNNKIEHGSVMRSGSGDISELYAGVGVTPFKGLYLGANIAYMFGTLTNDVYAYAQSSSTSLFQRNMKVRDYDLSLGVQYTAALNPDHQVTLGATFAPGKDLHGDTYGLYYDTSSGSKVDTVGYTSLKGNNTIPMTIGAGINYRWRQKLMVEADFTYQPWSKAKYASIEDFEETSFANRYKAALGLEYQHQARGTYLQRISWRAGAYYNHDYLMIRGNNVREIGASVGLGLPVPGFKTTINLAIEYKHRQAHPTPMVKENYLCVSLGVNFNEMWFRKAKIY